MKKSISTQELESKVGEIMDSVSQRGDCYVIERDGKPVAAMVPVEVLERDERERASFFDLIERIHERNKGIPEEELQAEIDQAVMEVRAERQKKRVTA